MARRWHNIKLIKKLRQPRVKGPKLNFSERCDQCGAKLQVCRVRCKESFELARDHKYPTSSVGGEFFFFCSLDCEYRFEKMTDSTETK